MSKTSGQKSKRLCIAAMMLALPVLAFADSTWSTSTCSGSSSVASVGNVETCSANGGVSVSMTAWSNTGSGGTFSASKLVEYSGGYGVLYAGESSTAPNHTMDNSGYLDSILLNFSSSVVLSQFTLGWAATDSDITLMRYDGATKKADGTSYTAADLVNGKASTTAGLTGWNLVNNYLDVAGSNPNPPAGGTSGNWVKGTSADTSKGSSWWLISAYNKGVNGGTSPDALSDYVKLLAFATTTPVNKTPEPASLALALTGLGGIYWLRRRRSA